MGQINFSTIEINRLIAYRHTAPLSDIVDNTYNSTHGLGVEADTEYRLYLNENDLARNFTNGFNADTGIITMYNHTDQVTSWAEFDDTPVIVLLPNLYFKPSSASQGECEIKCYVNETVPLFHDQAVVSYKGQVFEKMGDLFSVYLGDEIGYNVHQNGVYFTFKFDHAGTVYNFGLLQYLT